MCAASPHKNSDPNDIGSETKLLNGAMDFSSWRPVMSVSAYSSGSLFLCGDAAHIVPPTGAKGLNLAASDVHYLCEAFVRYFTGKDESGLREYSSKALSRVWHAMRFSWWMSNLLHVFPEVSPFDAKISESEFDYLVGSENGRRVLAENYTGLPY